MNELPQNFRPRYGAANAGYDMVEAQVKVPPPIPSPMPPPAELLRLLATGGRADLFGAVMPKVMKMAQPGVMGGSSPQIDTRMIARELMK